MTPTNTPDVARLAEELLPCPFCGNGGAWPVHYQDPEDSLWDTHCVRCVCAAEGAARKTPALAAEAWNRRSAKQDAAPTSASTVPAGFWLAPMKPDAEMFDAAKYDESFIEAWDDMRNAYLARNPGACSVTDGEA